MAVEIANIVPQMVWMIGDLVGTIAGVTHCGEDLKRKPLASLSVMDTKRRYQMNDKPKLPKEQVDHYKKLKMWPPPRGLTLHPWSKERVAIFKKEAANE